MDPTTVSVYELTRANLTRSAQTGDVEPDDLATALDLLRTAYAALKTIAEAETSGMRELRLQAPAQDAVAKFTVSSGESLPEPTTVLEAARVYPPDQLAPWTLKEFLDTGAEHFLANSDSDTLRRMLQLVRARVEPMTPIEAALEERVAVLERSAAALVPFARWANPDQLADHVLDTDHPSEAGVVAGLDPTVAEFRAARTAYIEAFGETEASIGSLSKTVDDATHM